MHCILVLHMYMQVQSDRCGAFEEGNTISFDQIDAHAAANILQSALDRLAQLGG